LRVSRVGRESPMSIDRPRPFSSLIGRRPRLLLRCFKPPRHRLSDRPGLLCWHEKTRCRLRHRVGEPTGVVECHKRRTGAGREFAHLSAKLPSHLRSIV
jgi:hypothetical protein